MSKQTNIDVWLESGEYLPDILRDFHDQKDIFKSIHELINVEGHAYAKDVNWIAGQCYVIDIFLWWMAKRGYVLQRTHRKGNFRDLHTDISECEARRNAAFTAAIKESKP